MTDRTKIEELVQQELEEANKLHPMFYTLKDAYGVIKEEFEETVEELDEVGQQLQYAWKDGCREDDAESFLDAVEYAKFAAIRAVQESIQLAAMCQKALDSNLTE